VCSFALAINCELDFLFPGFILAANKLTNTKNTSQQQEQHTDVAATKSFQTLVNEVGNTVRTLTSG